MTFISQLAQIGVYLLALVAYFHLIPALRSLGTVLLTGVSVTSIIIGLAAQNTLGNLIAGVSIVLYRPIEIGERVQVSAPTGLETGNIESLNLGYSVLRTPDNRRVIIPNSIMANSVLVNLTRNDARTISSVPVIIGHAKDIDQAAPDPAGDRQKPASGSGSAGLPGDQTGAQHHHLEFDRVVRQPGRYFPVPV